MSVLLSFIDERDPFLAGLIGDEQLAGPVLSCCEALAPTEVHLFHQAEQSALAAEVATSLRARHPALTVHVEPLPPGSPLDHLRSVLGALDGTPIVSITSGTPDQLACWYQLRAEGAFVGRFVDVHPPRYATDAPQVVDVALPARRSVPAHTVHEPRAAYAVAGALRASALSELTAQERADHLKRVMNKLNLQGSHPAFLNAVEAAAAVAEHSVPVLLQGETGTGKTLFARLIHELSGRGDRPFVALNCAALPAKLVESTLFGHRKGAFTGATQDQPGRFALADHGTIFLDEIGEMPLELQPKLLKVLEDGLVEPLGASEAKRVDVRVIAATNRDLQTAVEERAFREDLYYRLSFSIIALPPLRERRTDIDHIALHILDRLNRSLRTPKKLSPGALARLQDQEWRGNVRDLENVIGRSLLLCSRETLEPEDLLIQSPSGRPDPFSALPAPHEGFSLDDYLARARRQLLLKALDVAEGNQSHAARLLGLSPQAVNKFLKGEEEGGAPP